MITLASIYNQQFDRISTNNKKEWYKHKRNLKCKCKNHSNFMFKMSINIQLHLFCFAVVCSYNHALLNSNTYGSIRNTQNFALICSEVCYICKVLVL